MILLKDLSRKKFKAQFGTKESCMLHLANLKWQDGYSCRKCGSFRFIRGKQLYSQRCKACGYDESPTAYTLFHKVKFGIENAFEMLYDMQPALKERIVFGQANVLKLSKLQLGFFVAKFKQPWSVVVKTLQMVMCTQMSLKLVLRKKGNEDEASQKKNSYCDRFGEQR